MGAFDDAKPVCIGQIVPPRRKRVSMNAIADIQAGLPAEQGNGARPILRSISSKDRRHQS
jgi:hypothetical protein